MMWREEEVYAEEVVYGEHQVDDVEEDHPIDGGRLREYSEDEEVEVYGDEEVRYGEDATEEVAEEDEDVPETCWSTKDGNVSCLSLDPASAADRLVLAMLEQRRNMA